MVVLGFGDQVLLRTDRGAPGRGPVPMLVVDFEDGWPIVAFALGGQVFEQRVAAHDLWIRKRAHVISRRFPAR